MKLSVLIPAYNLENYIVECISSVCNQITSFGFEVIVCDDASTDKTSFLIKELAQRYPQIRPILKTKNGGLAENMKTLLSEASGEYIAYLDGDDVALPGKLQKQVDYLDATPDCQMVFHESDMFDSETNATIRLYSSSHYNWEKIPARSTLDDLVRYGTYMQASSVMFRRHEYLVESIIDECKIILDYPFYIMNAGFLGANIDYMPEVLGRYRIHNDSFGAQTQKSVKRRLQSLRDIIKACDSAKYFDISSEVIQRGIAHHQFAAALYFLYRKNDYQFQTLIEHSASQFLFFNQKHKAAWKFRHSPDLVRQKLAAIR